MRAFDRIIVTLAAFVVLFVGVVAVALVAGWNGYPVLGDLIEAARGAARVETGLLGLLTLAVGLFLLSLAWQRAEGADAIRIEGEQGDVLISLRAVESLVFEAAGQVEGIGEVAARLATKDEQLIVDISVMVTSERPMPEVAEDVQQRVKERVEAIVGVPVAQVGVNVRNVARPQRHRVE